MTTPSARPTLVLASGSRYRRELLSRLGLPFEWAAPNLDESALPGEAPRATALRLAEAKARALAHAHPHALVIGSDQVAELDGQPVNKPGTHERAMEQLARMQGREVLFHTALALLATATGHLQKDLAVVRVRFRRLPAAEIEFYLRREQPYDCAGAAKIETLGIALVERVDSDDPTALVGLPLIRLTSMLAAEGVSPLVP